MSFVFKNIYSIVIPVQCVNKLRREYVLLKLRSGHVLPEFWRGHVLLKLRHRFILYKLRREFFPVCALKHSDQTGFVFWIMGEDWIIGEEKMKDIKQAAAWIEEADAVLISASNGLSIAEGYHIFADNDDFKKYFGFFREKYGITCLIQGVFAQIPEHEQYMQTVRKYMIEDYSGSQVMKNLLELVKEKEYFIVTSNADTHFQMNGFDPGRIYEVEGNFDENDMHSPAWKEQQNRFTEFIGRFEGKQVLVLELGIGMRNQMIKKPLMDMVAAYSEWRYITLNMPREIFVPAAIADRSLALPGDIAKTFEQLLDSRN